MKRAFVRCTFSFRSYSCKYVLPWMIICRFFALLENWWTLMTYWKSLNMFCADNVRPSGCVSSNIRARTVGQFFFNTKFRFEVCRSIRFSSLFIHNERTFPKAMNGLCRILRVKVKLCLRTPWRRTESGGMASHILSIGTGCGRQLHASAFLLQVEELPADCEARLAPEPVWTFWRKSHAPATVYVGYLVDRVTMGQVSIASVLSCQYHSTSDP